MEGTAMVIGLTLIVAIVGVLMYVLCANPKLQEIGRLMFFAGLLAFLIGAAPELVRLGR
jgi:ABC-type arginine transport system permease subunit